jgi:hypothetical protein
VLVFGASSPGGSPSASPSGDDGRVWEVAEVAWAWRPGLLLQISWPLPSNKLKAGSPLDLKLGDSAGFVFVPLVL